MRKKTLTKQTRLVGVRKLTASGLGNWRKLFLESLRKIPNVTLACEAAHISRPTAYAARNGSQRFAEQWDTACIASREKLEAYAWVRATTGVKRGVWMKDEDGKPVKVEDVAEFSDGLMSLLLKAHWPERYRDPAKDGALMVRTPDGTVISYLVRSQLDPEEVTGPAPVGLIPEESGGE
jgi:hypothetical protein